MNALEFLRKPFSGKDPRPIYVLSGAEDYLRKEARHRIVEGILGAEGAEMGLLKVGGDADLATVMDELRTLPFLSPRRVVVVEEADPFITAHRKELESYTEKPSSTGVLILEPRTWTSSTRLAKLLDGTGGVIECKPPRDAELAGWLVEMGRLRWKTELEADAARLLVEMVGPEPGLLMSELEKLSVAVAPRPSIGRKDVARWVEAGRIETVWEMIDAATMGRSGEAVEALDRLLESGEPPVKLLSAISVSLLKVYHAGELRRRQKDLREACREAGVPPFAVEKVGKQHTHLGPKRVSSIPASLLQADLDLKGSSTLAPRTVLEALLIEWARPRADSPTR